MTVLSILFLLSSLFHLVLEHGDISQDCATTLLERERVMEISQHLAEF